MRRLLLSSIVLCVLAAALPARAQDVALNGIRLGMSLEDAQARLPPDLQITRPHTGFPPQVATIFAERIPFTGDDIDDEAYTIEAVNNRVAYIKRIVTHSPKNAPDRATFQQSLIDTYGAPSPYAPTAVQGAYPMWLWDRNGRLELNGDSCPGGLALGPGAKGLYRPVMTTTPSANPDLPGCHVVLFVVFDRRTNRIPWTKLDWVEYSLSDDSMFFKGLSHAAIGKSSPPQ